jgi:hypothetical protein
MSDSPPVTLEFLARQLQRVLEEVREFRTEMRSFREEMRVQGAITLRLETTSTKTS